jgi:hypothetical protein
MLPAWETIVVPDHALEPRSMLSVAERRLLFWLGAEYVRGNDAIIDLGCFLGGSTVALAEGIRANPRATHARVDVFDRFVADEFMADHYLAEHGLRPGDSFRPVFDANTAAVRDRLVVHQGDIAFVQWEERPIEVLFIDIAKTWELGDVVNRRFLPLLVPGRSIVVQQDMAHAFCPWLAITMELLTEHFELLGYVEHNSVVYRCRAPIAHEALPELRALSADRKVALLDQAIARFEGTAHALLRCARVMLLSELGEPGAARTELTAIRTDYSEDPVVAWEIGEVEAALTRMS